MLKPTVRLQGNALGLEHHLHRGRALAAFNHFLGLRVQKLKSEGKGQIQANVQADVQTLLEPITESEESLLSSVSFIFYSFSIILFLGPQIREVDLLSTLVYILFFIFV